MHVPVPPHTRQLGQAAAEAACLSWISMSWHPRTHAGHFRGPVRSSARPGGGRVDGAAAEAARACACLGLHPCVLIGWQPKGRRPVLCRKKADPVEMVP